MEQMRYKVLLVEDDKLDQAAFKRVVEKDELPYDYKISGSVSEARETLSSGRFDVVITDYRLGDGTAFDILELVKDTPTIVVTGAGGEEVAVRAWRAGAYDYLLKDMDRGYLRALPITVENALRNKNMEDKLRLLSGAVTSTDDSVYITDIEGKIIFVNKGFCKTYGYEKPDILGKDSNELWIQKWQGNGTRSVFQTQVGESAWTVGFYHRRKDGGIFPVSLTRSIIKDSKGNDVAVVAIARDITERIMVEDELRRENRNLQQHNKLNAELAITISETLRKMLAEENIDEGSDNINRRVQQAKQIINDFIEISQITSGKIKLEQSTFDICSAVSDVLQATSSSAEQKGVRINVSMPESELIVNADRGKLIQAITCLVSNSIESTAVNSLIELRLRGVSDKIIIELQDEGPGIRADQAEKIFDLFEQIKEQLRHKDRMLSLSLPIVKGLIDLHGGKVWVKPGADKHSTRTFCLNLPRPVIKKEVAVAVGEVEI